MTTLRRHMRMATAFGDKAVDRVGLWPPARLPALVRR